MGTQIEYALRQSTHRVIDVLAAFLPGLVVFLLAILLLTLVGWGTAVLLRKILLSMRFDERVSGWHVPGAASSLGDWSPAHSPSALAARSILWLFILVGIAVGITGFDAAYEANSQVALFVLPYLTHLVGAVLIFFAGSLIAGFLSRSVLISAVNAQLQYARVLAMGVKWLVLVLTAAMALDHLHIGGVIVELAFGILFGGIVFALALAVGLGSRDLVTRSIERIERPTEMPSSEAPRSSVETMETPRPRLRHF